MRRRWCNLSTRPAAADIEPPRSVPRRVVLRRPQTVGAGAGRSCPLAEAIDVWQKKGGDAGSGCSRRRLSGA